MEQEDLATLPTGKQEEYNAYRRIFESDAWVSLMEYVKQQAAAAAARQLAATNWDQYMLSKGQRLSYTEIANLEVAVENENLSLVEEIRAKQIAEDEEVNE